jgi:hypothetical protein
MGNAVSHVAFPLWSFSNCTCGYADQQPIVAGIQLFECGTFAFLFHYVQEKTTDW